MSDLVLRPAPEGGAPLAPREAERLRAIYGDAIPENTRKAYRGDWQRFERWCSALSLDPLPAPPATIARYLAFLAEEGCTKGGVPCACKASTIDRALSAICVAHRWNGTPFDRKTPAIANALRGIKRRLGSAPKQKAAIQLRTLRAMLSHLPDDLTGLRDRALLCFGVAFAQRSANLVAVRLEHVEWTDEGVRVFIPRSKTDQEGVGMHVGVMLGEHADTCPVRTLRKWLKAAKIEDGFVFRATNRGVVIDRPLRSDTACQIVQRCAAHAGLDPKLFGSHSLRAGFVTMAHLAGKSEAAIMKQTGHKSAETLRKYIRKEGVFVDNPTKGIGL